MIFLRKEPDNGSLTSESSKESACVARKSLIQPGHSSVIIEILRAMPLFKLFTMYFLITTFIFTPRRGLIDVCRICIKCCSATDEEIN